MVGVLQKQSFNNQVYQRPREWRDDGEQIETFGSLITSFDPQQR